jgi:hypothetical protein
VASSSRSKHCDIGVRLGGLSLTQHAASPRFGDSSGVPVRRYSCLSVSSTLLDRRFSEMKAQTVPLQAQRDKLLAEKLAQQRRGLADQGRRTACALDFAPEPHR